MQPYDDRQNDNNFNSSDLNISWIVDSFKNDTMTLNLSFIYPLEISPSIMQDKLIINFNQSQSLLTCFSNGNQSNIGTILSDFSKKMSYDIPK